MATFLLKTEPGEYAYDDLVRDGTTRWEGVRNNAALLHLRAVRTGDEALIYHTGDQRRIAGLARVVRGAYEDPSDPGANDKGEPKWAVVDIAPLRAASKSATLADIKADARFRDFALVKQGRLSVMGVAPALDKALREMAGL